MPDFPIIDAHVHIYDTGPPRLSMDRSVYTHSTGLIFPKDYNRITQGVKIEAMVFVEVDAAPGAHLAEVEFVQEQSRIEPRLRAIVASMPLEKGAARTRSCGLSLFPLARGVRRLI